MKMRQLVDRLTGRLQAFSADRSASTAIEYALIATIAIAIIAVVGSLGDSVFGLYDFVADAVAVAAG